MKANLIRLLLVASVVLGVTAQQAAACSPFVANQRFRVKERKPVRNAARFVLPPYGKPQAFVVGQAPSHCQSLRLQSGGCGALLLIR